MTHGSRPVVSISVAVCAAVLALLLSACVGDLPSDLMPSTAAPNSIRVTRALPPTWTPATMSWVPSPTSSSPPSSITQAPPTVQPLASITPALTPAVDLSPTLIPSDSPTPTPTPVLVLLGPNLLPNPSFEAGWYHTNGIAELQIPSFWTFEWEEGANPLDPESWNRWVRPEMRLLSREFLPVDEHGLFIWDGAYTVKVFKRQGAISFRLTTTVSLLPGHYLLSVNVFPDLISDYGPGGTKIWAPDPLSGEIRLLAPGAAGDWLLPRFGERNLFTHTFEVAGSQLTQIGVAIRGRWAIENNGWFMDDWALHRTAE